MTQYPNKQKAWTRVYGGFDSGQTKNNSDHARLVVKAITPIMLPSITWHNNTLVKGLYEQDHLTHVNHTIHLVQGCVETKVKRSKQRFIGI